MKPGGEGPEKTGLSKTPGGFDLFACSGGCVEFPEPLFLLIPEYNYPSADDKFSIGVKAGVRFDLGISLDKPKNRTAPELDIWPLDSFIEYKPSKEPWYFLMPLPLK